MDLFATKGFNSTSVADILDRSGANSGSLYHFFPSKQDVLVGVLEAYRDGIDRMLLEPAWSEVDDPIEKVFALLAAYRGMLVDTDLLYGCPIGSLALELHEPDPRVRELLAQNFSAWAAAVEDCLTAVEDRWPAGIRPSDLAEFSLTTMEGGVMLARTHRDVGYFDRAVACLRSYFSLMMKPAGIKRS